jgi:hypothetical protein
MQVFVEKLLLSDRHYSSSSLCFAMLADRLLLELLEKVFDAPSLDMAVEPSSVGLCIFVLVFIEYNYDKQKFRKFFTLNCVLFLQLEQNIAVKCITDQV